ncbi:mannose/glucose-specific lectin Cramoll-like [Salvia miltiorrhiza]|uniref:mannose/glucose-specific lectin Cramoll-like n=1 Tax=Salvia miltiorrhiza TaxID=226208 RepID=UPI0025AD96E3|nr:mannose/glucose-specific lectin Cramoll-like [Salvia miltiorrhiza]
MANQLVQTLTPLLASIALLLAVSNTALSQTTSFTYDFWGDQPKDLIYQGSAHFPTDSTFLRLTDAQPSQVGRVLHSNPVQFSQSGGQVDFETTVNFIITPGADNEPADGLAFFIAPVGSTIPPGSNGANLGIFGSNGNSPSVFAVEIDTYVNGAWDPLYPHIGIDFGSRASSNTTKVDNSILGQQVTARINYVGATRMISVKVTAGSQTFDVNYEYDLSDFVPQQVQVGLSAATGQHVAVHDIVSWYFTATMVQKNAAVRFRKELNGNIIRQFV